MSQPHFVRVKCRDSIRVQCQHITVRIPQNNNTEQRSFGLLTLISRMLIFYNTLHKTLPSTTPVWRNNAPKSICVHPVILWNTKLQISKQASP